MAAGRGNPEDASGQVCHASTVVAAGRAAMIRGSAGAGKSGLALQMIALGARLVADDRTRLWRDGDRLMADAPDTIRGRIEARGVGILAADSTGPAQVKLVVDMDETEDSRLPPDRSCELLGLRLPLVRKSDGAHFPAAILLYLTHGRVS